MPDYAELVRFGAVGVVNTLADIAVFWLLIEASLPPAIANVLSYSCGVIVSFSLNRVWTFRRAGTPVFGQLWRFVSVNIGSLVVSTVAVALGALFMPPLVAKLASFPLSFAWNFGFSRYWVFIHRRG
jgi:putative flippase GtrA